MKIFGLSFLGLFFAALSLFLVRFLYLDDFNFGLLFGATLGLVLALSCFIRKSEEG
jgi:hypothetical protein